VAAWDKNSEASRVRPMDCLFLYFMRCSF
jgi:hypothetical protein